MKWNFEPEMDLDDNDAPFVLVHTHKPPEDEVSEMASDKGCEGISIGCSQSAVIAQQLSQSFALAGSNMAATSAQIANQSLFSMAALNGTIVKNFSELDAIESQANSKILNPGT